jgi:hypothetical protein
VAGLCAWLAGSDPPTGLRAVTEEGAA